MSNSDREENMRRLWRKHVEETIDRVADCNFEISNYDEEQEEARHVDEVNDRVANRNYKVPNWKGSEMSWKEYELKETNEEQRQESDQIVDLLMRRGYDLTSAFSIASVGITDGHAETDNTDKVSSELILTDEADEDDVSQVIYKERQQGNRKYSIRSSSETRRERQVERELNDIADLLISHGYDADTAISIAIARQYEGRYRSESREKAKNKQRNNVAPSVNKQVRFETDQINELFECIQLMSSEIKHLKAIQENNKHYKNSASRSSDRNEVVTTSESATDVVKYSDTSFCQKKWNRGHCSRVEREIKCDRISELKDADFESERDRSTSSSASDAIDHNYKPYKFKLATSRKDERGNRDNCEMKKNNGHRKLKSDISKFIDKSGMHLFYHKEKDIDCYSGDASVESDIANLSG